MAFWNRSHRRASKSGNAKRLLKRLTHRKAEVRTEAAEKLGELGDSSAVDGLIRVLNDEAWSVAAEAMRALGKLGDDRAAQPVLALLERSWKGTESSLNWTEEACVETLSALGFRGAEPMLRTIDADLTRNSPAGDGSAFQTPAQAYNRESRAVVWNALKAVGDQKANAAAAEIFSEAELYSIVNDLGPAQDEL